MSFESRITPSMIDVLEIIKQHQYFSKTYACRIKLSDGREKAADLEASSLYSLISVIAKDSIWTQMDFNDLHSTLREDYVYGTFAEGGDELLTHLFNTKSKSNCACSIL